VTTTTVNRSKEQRMSRFVWAIRTVGGNPAAVHAAVTGGVERLRSRIPVPALTGSGIDEQEPWQDDVDFVAVSDPAADGPVTSILVDISLFDRGPDAEDLAAVLSSGFETVIADAVMTVDGVTEYSNTDRISRPD
jgi:hypothetical protein